MIKQFNGAGSVTVTFISTGRDVEFHEHELDEMFEASDEYKEMKDEIKAFTDENNDMSNSIELQLEGIRKLEELLEQLKKSCNKKQQIDLLLDFENILEDEVDILGRFI